MSQYFSLITVLGFLLSVQMVLAHQYALSVAAIFKDEAPYLKEWIEYHKLMGVQHFRLYNNDSGDDYLTVLSPYMQTGQVSLVDWPSSQEDLKRWAYATQWNSCLDAIKYYTGKSEWLALIDIDEFLFPLEHPDMVTFLQDYASYPGVALNWQCFGTAFIDEIPPGQLMIEALTLKAPELSVRNLPVKSIVKPECVDIRSLAWVPHTCRYINDQLAVYPNKERCPPTMENPEWKICTEKAVINHYVHRTENYFWNIKIAKKLRMENGGVITPAYVKEWRESCNKVEDKRIFRFIPALKNRMSIRFAE